MKKELSLTEGPVYRSLVEFALPILVALFLQSLYGAVDLLVVGRFATTSDVSGVSTGSQIMQNITFVIVGLAMGVTVLVGKNIGEKKPEEAGKCIGNAIVLFSVISIAVTVLMLVFAPQIAKLLQAPEEAFNQTVSYVRICCSGLVFIVAYNLVGSIFRGIGDSITPLITVLISCVLNIFGDILFVSTFGMGSSGAALATIISQSVSVFVSLLIIRRKNVPIVFKKEFVKFDKGITKRELKLGIPLALQDFLVGLSFLIITAIVNSLGLIASAGIGVGEKVCAFIMLIPSAFSQSMTAFVAQNYGAGKLDRNKKALLYCILTSIAFGLIIFYVTFFHGNVLASIFDDEAEVVVAAHSYLKAYAIDCMLTPILFCMTGFFSGYGQTTFVMLQGIIAAFCIRSPLAIIFGHLPNTSLFLIGLSTPCSTMVQNIICLVKLSRFNGKHKKLVK